MKRKGEWLEEGRNRVLRKRKRSCKIHQWTGNQIRWWKIGMLHDESVLHNIVHAEHPMCHCQGLWPIDFLHHYSCSTWLLPPLYAAVLCHVPVFFKQGQNLDAIFFFWNKTKLGYNFDMRFLSNIIILSIFYCLKSHDLVFQKACSSSWGPLPSLSLSLYSMCVHQER